MLSGWQVQVRFARVVLVGIGVIAAVMATRAWDDARPGAFVLSSIVALVVLAAAAFLLLPGPWTWRLVGVGAAVVIVAGVLGWGGVVSPHRDVSAAYDGDNVHWSRLVPKDQRTGEDKDEVSMVTALSAERAVITRDHHVLVIDPRTGRTVTSFTSDLTDPYALSVARTVDGFVIQGREQFAFYDADGKALSKVRGIELVARAPGMTVVNLDCPSNSCATVALGDTGQERWRAAGHSRESSVPIADEMPAYHGDMLDVVPGAIVLARDDETPASEPSTFDVLDAADGTVIRTFKARHAGSTLTRTGQSLTFAVQPDEDDRCRVVVWDADESARTEQEEDCAEPVGVTGDRLVFTGEKSSWIVNLSDPTESTQLSPPAEDQTERPPIVTETGAGGSTVLRLVFDGPNAAPSARAASGGPWGATFSTWWTYETPGDVTGAHVGEASVSVTSEVVPLNPWDDPAEDDRELTVIDLDSGDSTGRTRLDARLDDSVGLSDGSWLVALEGGRLLRVGGPA